MAAEEIMRFALYKEALKRQRRKKRKLNNGGASGTRGDDDEGSEEETDGEEDEDEIEVPERMSVPLAKGKDVPQPSQDPIWGDDSQDVQMDMVLPPATGPTIEEGVRPERYVVLVVALFSHFSTCSNLHLGCSYSVPNWRTCLQQNSKTMNLHS
jgi:DNA replication licensing factor MCM3